MQSQQIHPLVQAFKDGSTNYSTMLRAKATAEYDENAVMGSLGGGSVLRSPRDMSPGAFDDFVKKSVSAHVNKMQADQIEQAVLPELKRIEDQAKQDFVGKKIEILKMEPNSNPFEAVYVNNKTGEPRVSIFTSQKVSGTVEDLSIEKNVIIVKPNFWASKLVPDRVLFYIYPIDIETMQPQIYIS